jgi:uncharacterized membrane protein YagU involved in acid resistance
MNLRIPIPAWFLRGWDRFEDWSNVIVWERGKLYLVRLDVLSAIGFVFCVAYYWFTSGWRGALQGAAMYVFLSMIALWFFRPDRPDRAT